MNLSDFFENDDGIYEPLPVGMQVAARFVEKLQDPKRGLVWIGRCHDCRVEQVIYSLLEQTDDGDGYHVPHRITASKCSSCGKGPVIELDADTMTLWQLEMMAAASPEDDEDEDDDDPEIE